MCSRIFIIGEKPSEHNIDPAVPFVGTKSYKTLLEWVYTLDINITDVHLLNSTDLGLYRKIKHGLTLNGVDKIICLGQVALSKVHKIYEEERASNFLHDNVTLDRVFALPHPSGRNRKLNDKKYVDTILNQCKDWLRE